MRRKKKSGQDGAGFYDDDGNWVDLDWDGKKKKGSLDAAKVKMIGIGTGLAILIATSAYFIATDNAKPRARRKENRGSSRWRDEKLPQDR